MTDAPDVTGELFGVGQFLHGGGKIELELCLERHDTKEVPGQLVGDVAFADFFAHAGLKVEDSATKILKQRANRVAAAPAWRTDPNLTTGNLHVFMCASRSPQRAAACRTCVGAAGAAAAGDR